MYFWSILGITPTEDTSVIKKAYAAKLKLHHPEDDPEGYQTLREAYDSALKAAKQIKARQAYVTENITAEPANFTAGSTGLLSQASAETEENSVHQSPLISFPPALNLHIAYQSPLTADEQNNEFMLKLEALYHDFFSRIEIGNWKALLNSDAMWIINNRGTLGHRVFAFLSNHRYLPQEVWRLLDKNFDWCDRESPSRPIYNMDFLEYVTKQIKQAKPLRYSFFKPLEGVDYEKFLELREKAAAVFAEGNLPASSLLIQQAKQIYSQDPDLLLLEARYHKHSGDIDSAIALLDALLNMNPDDCEALFHRAAANFEKNRVEKSIEDYRRLYSKAPDNSSLPLLLAKSYYKLGNLDEAWQWINKALEHESSHKNAKELMSVVYAKMRRKLSADIKKAPSDVELRLKLKAMEAEFMRHKSKHEKKPADAGSYKGYFKVISIFGGILAVLFVLNLIFTPDYPKTTVPGSPPAAESGPAAESDPRVLTAGNLESIPSSDKKVQTTLKKVIHLPYCLFLGKSAEGKDKLSIREVLPGSSLNVSGEQMRMIFVGQLEDKTILFSGNPFYSYALKKSRDKSLVITGKLYESSQLAAEIEKLGFNTDHRNLVAGKIIVADDINLEDIDSLINDENISGKSAFTIIEVLGLIGLVIFIFKLKKGR